MKTKNNLSKIGLALLLTGAGSLFIRCADNFTPPSAPKGNTIVQVASTNDSLKAYVAAITKVGLNGNLGNVNGGQFTVFASSNYAFVKYLRFLGYKVGAVTVTTAGDSAIKYLNKITFVSSPLNLTGANSQKNLTSILNYHVISSNLPSSAIVGAQGFTTQNGARLSVSKTGASSFVLNANQYIASSKTWNGANITSVDLVASNGVIHVIDQVMTPLGTTGSTNSSLAFLGYTSSSTVSPIGYGITTTYNGGTTTDGNQNNYNLLAAALRITGQALVLFPNSTPLPDYTVFAPKDSAFIAKYAWGTEAAAYTAITTLTESTTPKLSEFTAAIKGLIVKGRYLTTDFTPGLTLTTLSGTSIPVTVGSKIFLNGGSSVWIKSKDGLTNAGIVHGTNGLLP